MSQYQIIIKEPNGVERTRPLSAGGLTIGREIENDLVIGYHNVSRRHAWVSFEQGQYYVTDLDSANGTYLGQNRLMPNEPSQWMPGQPLRISEVEIFLEPQKKSAAAPAGPAASAGSAATAEEEETRIGWELGPQSQTAKRGGKSRGLLILGLLLLFIVGCGVVAGGIYFFLL